MFLSTVSGKWWMVKFGIGLYGGDNTQHVPLTFTLYDAQLGYTMGKWSEDTYNWVSQNSPTTEHATVTAYVADQPEAFFSITNDDSASQCFNVTEYSWYE